MRVAKLNRRLGTASIRLCEASAQLLVQADDVARTEVNGGTVDELLDRLDAAVTAAEAAVSKITTGKTRRVTR